jgi:hypothetical protein
MQKMSSDEKQKIVETLNSKGARLPCPRCGNTSFTLLDGYFEQPIQSELVSRFIISGPSIPSVVVICNKCGYMSQHAIGVLGLMPNKEKKHEPK